jgi:hypothetical protein
MKVPRKDDVGRAERTAVDPNEMQSLAGKLESKRRMTPQFASASEIPSRNRTAPTALFPLGKSRLVCGNDLQPARLCNHRGVMGPGLDIIKSEPRPNLGQFLPINNAAAMFDCQANQGHDRVVSET